MSATSPIGPAITDAFRFLTEVHEDTATLVKALDRAFDVRGWSPTERNRISGDLGNSLTADMWVIQSIYRIYVESVKAAPSTRIVAVHIDYNPPKPYVEPMMLCIAARFATPVAASDLWDDWVYSGSEAAMVHLAQQSTPAGVHSLPKALLTNDLQPKAFAASAFVVPLCAARNAAALEAAVIKPLLDAVASQP